MILFRGYWNLAKCIIVAETTYRAIWLLLDSIHRLVCGSFTKDHNVSETACVSVLRWMGQDRPTQLGPSERANLNHWSNWVGLSWPIHLRTETDPVSETLWSFVKLPHTRRWIESKRSQIALYNIHHRQNPLKSIWNYIAQWHLNGLAKNHIIYKFVRKKLITVPPMDSSEVT
jgi:hypothetical protein